MSAAESEAVEVDVSASDFVEAEEATSSAGGARSGTTRRGFLQMLTATEPSESPEVQDGTLSTGAKWYQHLELAVKKATGSTGTPAWVNGIMAAFLLAAESAGLELGGSEEESSSSPSASSEESSSTSNEAVGQSAGTLDNGETNVITG